MHTAHTAKTQADLIFIYNGAPPALVGSQAADFGAMRWRPGSLTLSPARAAARGFRRV